MRESMPLLRETDLETICGGCRKTHNNNFSFSFDEHSSHTRYKTKNCEFCGYEISFQVSEGSRY